MSWNGWPQMPVLHAWSVRPTLLAACCAIGGVCRTVASALSALARCRTPPASGHSGLMRTATGSA